jgi:hypothetical protein
MTSGSQLKPDVHSSTLLTITGSPLLQCHWKCLKSSLCKSTALGQYKKLSLESSREAAFFVLFRTLFAFLTGFKQEHLLSRPFSASWRLSVSSSSFALHTNSEMQFGPSRLLSSRTPWSQSLLAFGQGMLPSLYACHPDLDHSRISGWAAARGSFFFIFSSFSPCR